MPTIGTSARFMFSLTLVITWAAAMSFAFWWFQFRWYQPPDPLTGDALFDASQIRLSRVPSWADLEVIHFYDNTCPCARFNTPHVQDLAKRYRAQNVRFRILVPDASQLDDAGQTFPFAEHAVAAPDSRPPASPSALVLSRESGPQYLGPWSPGAACNARSGDYVAQVLDQLLAGKQHNLTFQMARGCLCPWPNRYSLAQAGVFQ